MNLRDLVFFGIQADADVNPFKAQKPGPVKRDSSDRLSVEALMFNSESAAGASDQFLRHPSPVKSEPAQDFLYQNNAPDNLNEKSFGQPEQDIGLPTLTQDLEVPQVNNDVSFEMR